jgi:hypothetical protein
MTNENVELGTPIADQGPLSESASQVAKKCLVKMGGFILRITPITEPAKPIYYWAVVVRGVDED